MRAGTLVAHERNSVAAGVGDSLHFNHDDRSPRLRSIGLGEGAALEQLLERGIAGGHDLPTTVQPEDPVVTLRTE